MTDRIPNNEFSNDLEVMPSADVMYHNYIKFYNEKTCVKCGFKWYQKKSEPMLSDLCYKCRKESLQNMNWGGL